MCERCKGLNLIAGQAFTKYYCRNCHKPEMHANTAVPKLCRDCSDELNKCQKCMGDL